MARKDIFVMSTEELKRSKIIQKVLDKEMTQAKAAETLGLSDRQIRRIIKRVREEGDYGVTHRSRGKPSPRAIPKELKVKTLRLYEEKYKGFGPTLATEELLERDGISLSRETLRGWLTEEGLSYRKRRKRPHRRWRERKEYFGEMVQMDGSKHDWLEGRGPKLVLMGYIDDATNRVFARFYNYEGTIPAMDSFKRYVKKYGIPQSVYLDRHTTYKSNAKPTVEDNLNNTRPLSQFERALEEIGVRVIHANSPQAKGRIERLFGTLQDRLIKSMRVEGIRTIGEANIFLKGYLPSHNKKYSIKSRKREDIHYPIPKGVHLDSIFCIKNKRVLRNDNTIAHNGKLYQIEERTRAKELTVEERTDDTIHIKHKDRTLRYNEILTQPERAKEARRPRTHTTRKPYKPPADHPWRKNKAKETTVCV